MTRARDVADTQDNVGGAVAPFVAAKNVLINGSFDWWQRGTSFTNPGSAGAYQTDRWCSYFNGNGTITQETTVKPDTSTYSLKITATASSADNAIYQLVEQANMQQLRGKVVTLSVKLAGTVGLLPTVQLCYSTTANDGLFTTNTPINGTVISAPAINASTFVTYAISYLVPTTAKTLRIGFNSNTMANTNVLYIAEAQLELGNTYSPFSRAGGSIGGELALCQRYYQKSYNTDVAPGTATSSGSCGAGATGIYFDTQGWTPLQIPMRTTPTVTVYSSNTGASGKIYDNSAGADTSAAAGLIGFSNWSVTGTVVTGRDYRWHYQASAEL